MHPLDTSKSPEDKHKLIPDPTTAPIVRKIFALRCEGRSFRNIALTLNAEGIPTPRDYYYQSIGKDNPRNENPYWSGTTVKTILRNEVYIGNMVQNKFGTLSYKAHKQVAKPKEDWIRVEHTHEPLVSMATWELVRSLDEKPTRRRTMNNGKMALFAGVVFCMDCGSVMRHDYETRPRMSGKKSTYESYLCSRYSFSGKNACSAHVISQRALIQLVLTDIRLKASCAKQDPERLKEILRQKRNAASEEQRKAQEAQLKGLERRLAELDRLIPSTYEDKALGRIPEAVCIQSMKQYEAERQEKLAQKAELTAKLEICQQAEDSAEDWVAMMQDYSKLESLDRPTLLRLIDRIEIGERRKVNGQDERDIRIYYKFAGMVEV